MDELKALIAKLGSGRLFLVICTGITFVYCSIHKIITAEAIVTIITCVMTNYFNRSDRNGTKTDKP